MIGERQEAIIDLADIPDGLTRLSTALDYEVGALKVAADTFYSPLRSILIPLGLDYQSLTQNSFIQ